MTPREIVMTTTGIIREEVEGEVTLVIETLTPEETDTDTLPPPNDGILSILIDSYCVF